MGDPQFICRALTQGTTASVKGHSRTLAQATDHVCVNIGIPIKWVATLVLIAAVAMGLPRFGWGRAAQEKRNAHAAAERLASAACGQTALCRVRQLEHVETFAGPAFWAVRLSVTGHRDRCFQLRPDAFRAPPRHRLVGVAEVTCAR